MKILTVIVSILILIAVLIPGSKIPDVEVAGVDKLVHISMFSAWAVAFRFDFRTIQLWLLFGLGMTFSVFTEVVQLFAEGRSFDVYDMVFDAIGLLLGLSVSKPVINLLDRLFGVKR